MKIIARRTALMLAGVVGLASLLGAGAASALVPLTADPVLFWNDQAQALLPGATPVQSRSLAMLNIAIHDAVNASTGSQDRYYMSGVSTPGGDTRAAASQAAHDVLVTINPGNALQYDAALASSLGLISDGTAKSNGIATGAGYAAAMLASRSSDGSAAAVPYATTGLAGDWRPTPPALASAATPQWGGVTPFLMTSGDQFRPGPPPALGSVEYATAYNEVKAIGSATSAIRTADETAAAKFWASSNASQAWIRVGLQLADAEGLSTLENARAFALLSSVMADAQIAVFDSKYDYRLWRPVTAIRLGDTDGNALTEVEATWSSLVTTPAFPSYVSAHSALSEAAAISLSSIFGDDDPFCLTLTFGSRCFSNVDEAALDASNSRIWGGIHFRFDSEAGLALGEQLGEYALSGGFFSAVPEPSSWAMMLMGFGLLGALARHRSGRRRTLQLGPMLNGAPA
jgi:hypothetical protein